MLRSRSASRLWTAARVTVLTSALLVAGLAAAGSAWAAPVGPPAQPVITSGSAGFRSATVAFNEPFNDGAVITRYDYRIDAGAWQTLTYSETGNVVTGTIGGLTNGQSIEVEVRAINRYGPSAASDPYPLFIAGPPTPPRNVTATAGNASATVTFDPPVDSGGAGLGDYRITIQPSGVTVDCPASPCPITNLINGTTYTFSVVARSEIGSSQPAVSNPVTPRAPATLPGPPRNLTATPGNGSVRLSFLPPANDGGAPVTSYTATINPSGRTVTCPTSPCVVTGLTNGVGYTFTVHATNRVGNSTEAGPTATVRPVAAPAAAPTLSIVSTSTDSLTVSFAAPANGGSPITGYQYSLDRGQTWLPLTVQVNGLTLRATITGLASSTGYPLEIRALTAAGPGQASTVATGTTKALAPAQAAPALAATGTAAATNSIAAVLLLAFGLLLVRIGRRRVDPSHAGINPERP